MEINWSTFVLEIINFLVLIWLLKRFLYQPVRQIVEHRRQEIEARLNEAQQRRHEAEQMKLRYERRLTDWEEEKKQAWKTVQKEIEEERRRRLETLKKELDEEHRKAEVVWEKEKHEWQRHTEEQALALGAAFVARMLEQVADEHLHKRLLDLQLKELAHWPETETEGLRRDFGASPGKVKIISAYALNDEERQRLQTTLEQLLNQKVVCIYETDPSLLAGIRIDLGAYVIRANLKDELRFFSHAYT